MVQHTRGGQKPYVNEKNERVGMAFPLGMLLIGAAGLICLILLDGYYRSEVEQQNEGQLADAMEQARIQLGHNMGMGIHAIETLRIFLQGINNPEDFGAFDRYAFAQREYLPAIDAFVSLDVNYTVRHIHPASGHEEAIGVNLMRPSAADVRKAVRECQVVTDNPHTRINGELAFLTRAPVYEGDRFLGLAGVFRRR